MKITLQEQCSIIEFGSEKANSFTREMLADLAEAISTSKSKIILLKSSGDKAFSAGASFEEFKAITKREQAVEYFSGFMKVLEAMRVSQAPIICRVQGKAVGGAVGIIAAADYVFANSDAALKLSEIELGIGPFTISPALERKLGIAKFSEMLFDAEWKDSNWCLSVGMFNKVFSDNLLMDKEIDSFIEKLSIQSAKCLSGNRKLLWANTENWPAIMKTRVELVADLIMSTKK